MPPSEQKRYGKPNTRAHFSTVASHKGLGGQHQHFPRPQTPAPYVAPWLTAGIRNAPYASMAMASSCVARLSHNYALAEIPFRIFTL